MRQNDGKLTSGQLEGFRASKEIALLLRFAAGAWSAVQNPTNEAIALTGAAGAATITLANPGVAPLIVPGMAGVGGAPVLASAPTSAVVVVTSNAATDLHVKIVKQEQA